MLRAGMSARDRDDAARALSLAVMDFNNAAPVDVSPVLGEATLLEHVFDNVEPLPQQPDDAFASGLTAMRRVIHEQTDIKDAMIRQDVGSISFYWGTEGRGKKLKGGSGVSHLIARRNSEGLDGKAVAEKMVEVLAYGKAGKIYGPEGGQHVNISYDGYTAVLSLYRFRDRETWLLTGWKNDPVGETGAVNAPSPTQTNPSGIRDKLGATGSSESIPPLGKDGKPLFAEQNFSPDLSSAREPAAVKNWDTPEAAREAEARELAQQDEALRQQMAELEARGALDPDEAASARAESADTAAIGNEVLHCAWTAEG